jgi:hypothetical protein
MKDLESAGIQGRDLGNVNFLYIIQQVHIVLRFFLGAICLNRQ